MIRRDHLIGDTFSSAAYSPCARYRYQLTRTWGPGPKVLFVMLNPSTATELHNDPTVERCEQRARAMGFAAFGVTNIFAWRDTKPEGLRVAADPIGPENDAAIGERAGWASMVICAWGNHGAFLDRGAEVAARLRGLRPDIWHLGLTVAGHPKHPLYLGYARQPELWR